MASATVTNTLLDAAGNALVGVRVLIEPYPIGTDAYGADLHQIAPQTWLVTNNAGLWSAALERTDTAIPSGLTYRVTEFCPNSLTRVCYITVPAGGGTMESLLTQAPASVVPPGALSGVLGADDITITGAAPQPTVHALPIKRMRLGTENPNPGIARLRPLPAVHPSPPFVKTTQTGQFPASTIASAVTIAPTDPRLQYLGAKVTSLGGGSYAQVTQATTVSVGSGSGEFPLYKVSFLTDAPVVEAFWNNQGGSVQVMVDGQWVSDLTNLLASNPNFTTNTTGWANINGGVVSRITSPALFGGTAGAVNVASSQYSGVQFDTGTALVASTPYEIAAWLQSSTVAWKGELSIVNAGGSVSVVLHPIVLGLEWQYFRASAVSPASVSGNVTWRLSGADYASSASAVRIAGAVASVGNASGQFQPAPFVSPSDNGTTVMRLDFGFDVAASSGARKLRQITFYFSGDLRFGGLQLGPTDSLIVPYTPKKPRVIFASDSWSENNVLTVGYVERLCQIMGWQDGWNSASGGTGFTNAGSRVNLTSRYVTDIINNSPDIVVLATGQNDSGQNLTTVQANVTTICAALKAAGIKLICIGPYHPSGSPNAAKLQVRDAIFAGANGYADLLVDPLVASGGPRSNGTYLLGDGVPAVYDGTAAHYVNLGFVTGTGKQGALTGSGNADIIIASDGSHMLQAGHDYLPAWLAQAISSAMPF